MCRFVWESFALPTEELADSLDQRFQPEAKPKVRSEALRDRDRILYCPEFLRLGNITQVAVPETGQIFHSRLIHSLKVAQVAHGLAQRFKAEAAKGELDEQSHALVDLLDENAVEAAALAHDLGHPPFGHIAEKALQDVAGKECFEGNAQSFRIVTMLALHSAPTVGTEPNGLNLTKRTLNGILKYPWKYDLSTPDRSEKWGVYADEQSEVFEWVRKGLPEGERTLEAVLMDWADDVTYALHDLEDFYRAGLIPLERLTALNSEELDELKQYLRRKPPKLANEPAGDDKLERLDHVLNSLFESGPFDSFRAPYRGTDDQRIALRTCTSSLISKSIATPQLEYDEQNNRISLMMDEEVFDQISVLKRVTWYYVIDRPSMSVIQTGWDNVVRSLFGLYHKAAKEDKDFHVLPSPFARRAELANDSTTMTRIVVDLISGLTEAGAQALFSQSFGTEKGSLFAKASGPN